jgi:hypothetical protein
MKTLVEAIWEKDGELVDGEPPTAKGKFWLHHWGLQHQVIDIGDGKLAVGTWTVGICEDYKTGDIRCFMPEQLKVIGHEIQK